MLLALALACAPAEDYTLAASAVPTEQGFHAGVGGTTERGQTFTLATGGAIRKLELWLQRGSSNDDAPLVLDLRPTDEAGVPVEDDEAALATVEVEANEIRQEVHWAPLEIYAVASAGDVLAIRLASPEAANWNYGVLGDGDLHDGGGFAERDVDNHPWSVGTEDMGFKVWVEP